MSRAMLKIAFVVLVALSLVVPVSAKTSSQPAGPVVNSVPPVAPNLVDWYENWDAYPTGQNMHGVGGWKGWFNNPAATAYTSAVQSLSSPNSIDIHGDSDLVHEYAIDSGVWGYGIWQYVPSNFSGTSYFILLNDYDDGGGSLNWSVEVQFDSATNSVINDGPAGGVLPLIRDQWVYILVMIDLDADTQAFYYGVDQLFQGSWSDGMSGGGLTSIAAVDLFANGASPIYYDNLFLVEAVVQEPMHVADIWGNFLLDPYGRTVLKAYVTAHNANHVPLGSVAVEGWIWVPPNVGPLTRTRMTKEVNGTARFHWGSNYVGTWTLCVNNLTKDGFLYVPGDNDVPECANWNN